MLAPSSLFNPSSMHLNAYLGAAFTMYMLLVLKAPTYDVFDHCTYAGNESPFTLPSKFHVYFGVLALTTMFVVEINKPEPKPYR